MERIQALINQLKDLSDRQADPQALMALVQQIQQELSRNQLQPRSLGTSKVAVLMPAAMMASQELVEQYGPKSPEPAAIEAPVVSMPQAKTPSVVQENGKLDMRFDPMIEIPTLSQQVQSRNDQSTSDIPSLNDRLKESKTELAERLKEAPVKDLRKAIGINDRFLFINELFRGDEAMYERSIKTINGFNIYAEAEYWITRELKTKLGWNIDLPAVLQFDQLVKRRFS